VSIECLRFNIDRRKSEAEHEEETYVQQAIFKSQNDTMHGNVDTMPWLDIADG
jgi:hypothetical protein